jgi:hypothetical protein
MNTNVAVKHRVARTSPSLTQDQRLGWIHELLTGSSEALPYRVAGMLLLLYAQPLVRIVALQTSDVASIDSQLTLRLGKRPSPSPNPSPSSSGPTLRIGRTCAPAPDPTVPGSSPAPAPDSTSTPTP